MAILREFVKFLKFVVLFVFLLTTNAQKCGISEFQNPLSISTSPGFLSGAIQHVGNPECTESGICLHIPSICPNSSCCVSSTPANIPANISIPASLSTSKCGCWDSVRKICKPVSNILIGYTSCDSQNKVQIRSSTQISRGSQQMISKVCKGNTADIQLTARNEGSSPILQIKTLACTQPSQRMGRQGTTDGGIIQQDIRGPLMNVAGDGLNILPPPPPLPVVAPVEQAVNGRDTQKTLSAIESAKYKTTGNSSYVSSQSDGNRKNVPLQCATTPENNFFAISSNFLSGTINNFLGQNTGICSGQGLCGVPKPGCQSTSCCLVSASGDGNSSGDSCECVGIGNDTPNACLLHHKIYKVSSVFCTETGEKVQRSLSVRIPSNGLTPCISGADSWEKGSIKFGTNDNDNLEAIIEIRKCILSAASQEYLEIEEVVKAELNLDIASKILKQIE